MEKISRIQIQIRIEIYVQEQMDFDRSRDTTLQYIYFKLQTWKGLAGQTTRTSRSMTWFAPPHDRTNAGTADRMLGIKQQKKKGLSVLCASCAWSWKLEA